MISTPIDADDFKNAMQVFLTKKKMTLISIEGEEKSSVFNVHFGQNDGSSNKCSFNTINHELVFKASDKKGAIFIFSCNIKGSNRIDVKMIVAEPEDASVGFNSILDLKVLDKVNKLYFELGDKYNFYQSSVTNLPNFLFNLNSDEHSEGYVVSLNQRSFYHMSTMPPTNIFLLNGPVENIPYYIQVNIDYNFTLCYENGEINFKYDLIIPVSSNKTCKYEIKSKNGRFKVDHIKKNIEQKFDTLICQLIKTHGDITIDSFKDLSDIDQKSFVTLLDMVTI